MIFKALMFTTMFPSLARLPLYFWSYFTSPLVPDYYWHAFSTSYSFGSTTGMRSLSSKQKQQEWYTSLKMTDSKNKTSHLKITFDIIYIWKILSIIFRIYFTFQYFQEPSFSPWNDIDFGCVPKLNSLK